MTTDRRARQEVPEGCASPEVEPSCNCCWDPYDFADLHLRSTSVSTARATLESSAGSKVGGMAEHSQSASWAADTVPDMRE